MANSGPVLAGRAGQSPTALRWLNAYRMRCGTRPGKAQGGI